MAGFGGGDSAGDGVQIAHFTDEDDVRILTERRKEAVGEGTGVYAYLALIHDALGMRMNILDRIFQRNDMLFVIEVDLVYYGLSIFGQFVNSNKTGTLINLMIKFCLLHYK